MITLSLLALAAQAAPPDGCQDAPSDEPCADTIVVVGRVASPAAGLPVSADLLRIDALEDQAIASLTDALATLPGVQVVATGPVGNQASVFVRGTDSDHVLITFDGIRLNSPATPNGAYDFGQELVAGTDIEFLRGPASATYGSDAIGGVVNLAPHRGRHVLSLSAGELSTYAADVRAGWDDARSSGSVGGSFLRTDGYDAVPGRIVAEERDGERDGSEAYTLTAKAEGPITGNWSWEVTGYQRESEAAFDGFSGGATGFQRASDPDRRARDRLSVGRAGLRWSDEGRSAILRLGLVDGAFEETDGGAATGDVEGQRAFAEALGTLEKGPLTVSGGVVAERERVRVPISFNDPLSGDESHLGAFLYARREAGPFVLSGAVRADAYEGFDAPVTANLGALWRGGGWRAHAAVGTAYNVPTLSERFSTSLFTRANPDLAPEEARAGEIGIGYEGVVREGTWTAGLTLFRTDTDDLIEYVFGSGRNENVGDARAQGAEVSARLALPRLTARLAYTYTDAEDRETGRALLRRPEHGVAALLDWQATARLAVSGRWTHVGARPDVAYDDAGFFVGTRENSGFDDTAVTVRYAVTDGLTGFATLTNALDRTYEQPFAFGSPPRALRVGVRYRWR